MMTEHYEWKCPDCKKINKDIGISMWKKGYDIVCTGCNRRSKIINIDSKWNRFEVEMTDEIMKRAGKGKQIKGAEE